MDLTIRYLLSIPFARRAINEKKAAVVTPCSTTKRVNPGTFSCTATASITTDKTPFERETQKHNLLRAIQDTQRGLVATSDQRSSIEEALVRFPTLSISSLACSLGLCAGDDADCCVCVSLCVCVEGYEAGSPIDLVKLDGTWRLQYTSAPDVLVLLVSAARLPFFQVGQIYQKFECRDNSDCGIVRNVVRWSIPSLLEEQEGATLLVSAKFSVVSKRNINLQFEEILQFIRGFRAQFPLRSSERKLVGGLYYLTYLDGNMLLGRAVGGGGVFVFTKAQPLT
ncbi:probable plastid-lipid-associated protein 10, chloroplastic isoform X2 [Macadamia integrifolia]|uniref:probable plastid-lipid-associated protein 10, chloroplastic isoform X2 n=1 Tax=Macadamia integrifolia TaxID=60698 RepID=UPI001C4EDF26|nr:probable plastid-lipid-associated protein 10, chloroplastic isoform X2 [Macadamia integrifolia]